jgi:hypothetical protein
VLRATKELGIDCKWIDQNQIEINRKLTTGEQAELDKALSTCGEKLVLDSRALLSEKIKEVLQDFIEPTDPIVRRSRLSEYLPSRLLRSYPSLSRHFSQEEGKTIEHYLIEKRIERVKELLCTGELSLTEISYRLNYSSVAHLSHQFKEVTGQKASDFRHTSPAQCFANSSVGVCNYL